MISIRSWDLNPWLMLLLMIINMKNPPLRGNYKCFSSITERELESALLLINFRLIIQHHVNPLFICVAYTNVDCY